jgi:hypothetical protein
MAKIITFKSSDSIFNMAQKHVLVALCRPFVHVYYNCLFIAQPEAF